MYAMIYTPICQVSIFPEVLRTSHFLLGTQTYLVLFMVEIISFGTLMRLALFPLLACFLALMATTFLFFFFLIKYGVAAFLSTLLMYVLEILLVGFFFFSPGVYTLHS